MVVEGAPQQLALTSTTATAVQLTASPGSICTIDSQRRITAVAEGVCNIRAFQPSTRQLEEGEATVSFTIYRREINAKMSVALDWPRPASIDEGTALGPEQLNARATMPGRYSYSPVAGTILPGGISELTVTFTPDDLANYLPVTTSVRILVNRATAPTPTASRTEARTATMPASLTVNFEKGSAQLTTRAKGSIRSYVNSLRVANVNRLEILGFTDSMPGCGRYAKSICWGGNKQLSKDRADSVHRFLSSLMPGIKTKVLGLSSTNPVASNSTYSGRQTNRRVTITPLP